MIWLAAALYWLFLFLLAALNGALREFIFIPLLGRALALPLSGLSLILILVAAGWTFVHWKHPSLVQATGIGLLWMALTLAGEAALALRSGKSLMSVAEAFSISAIGAGELFAVAVLAVGVTPLLCVMILQSGTKS